MFYVYILKLNQSKNYIGFSSNLRQRIKDHMINNVSQTKNYKNKRLIYYSAFKSKLKALRFEKYLKTPSGFSFRNKRLT